MGADASRAQLDFMTAEGIMRDDVYYRREGRGIGPLRVALHRAVVAAIDAA
jgi:hypothetical protein